MGLKMLPGSCSWRSCCSTEGIEPSTESEGKRRLLWGRASLVLDVTLTRICCLCPGRTLGSRCCFSAWVPVTVERPFGSSRSRTVCSPELRCCVSLTARSLTPLLLRAACVCVCVDKTSHKTCLGCRETGRSHGAPSPAAALTADQRLAGVLQLVMAGLLGPPRSLGSGWTPSSTP